MQHDIIYSSEYVRVTKQPDGYYIESYEKGMSVEGFNKLMATHVEIKITSFMAIKNALIFAPKPLTKFGEAKERVVVEVSNDELKACITLCVFESEFGDEKKVGLIREIIKKLNEKGVVYGVKHDVLLNNLVNHKQILIAEGTPAENGTDSVIKMYELQEAKPEIKEGGNVDHYELNLINRARKGEWLGERIDPTEGVQGKSVRGNVLMPMPGKKYPMIYDKKSVREHCENGTTTLYALRDGAIFYEGDRISVSNHLEITENVDFRTGNIDFEGFLTIKGSVEDNFSVAADNDIEILGDYGVGSIKEILSREGSIYIKGGIAGKSKAVVKSKKDIYTKFVSDATIICDGRVHIGFYCLNSNIIAKEVILDSSKGQIIGGNIQAEIKVVSSILGSASEKRTAIFIKGFNRAALRDELEKVVVRVEELKNEVAKSKQEIAIYTNTSDLTREQRSMFERIQERYYKERNELKKNEDERKTLINYLKTHGEGEVVILKKAYPNTLLEIKKVLKEINQVTIGTSFYFFEGKIKEA
jgi:uncharacterized protein